jgi:hypothetical protein
MGTPHPVGEAHTQRLSGVNVPLESRIIDTLYQLDAHRTVANDNVDRYIIELLFN